MTPSTLAPSVALAAYAEPLVAGRRVVVFGDATSGLAEYLIDRGARLVHVYDHEPARIAEASSRSTSRNISFAPLGQAGIAVRDAAFDFGVIENLALALDPGELLQRLARSLSARGAALIAIPNPDARLKLLVSSSTSQGATIGYYELYDRVAEHFQEVRMLGQLPFVGYAVADFSPDHEPNISIDTSLVPSGAEEPEWFLALASQQSIESDAFTIVELPFAQTIRPGQDPDLDPALSRARAQEQVLLERIAKLETEATELRAAKSHAGERQLSAAQADLKQQIVDLKDQIGKRDAWLAQLEARAATADTRADQAEADLEKLKHHTAKTAPPPGSPASELQAERDTLARERDALARERDTLQGERETLESTGAELRSRIVALESQADLSQNEMTKLEAQLKERGGFIQKLERDLKEAERTAADLVRELKDAQSARPESPTLHMAEAELSELRNKLDNLAFANAEREANLLAADWTISELEAKLAALITTGGASDAGAVPSHPVQEDETSPSADAPR
jgi:hypothetical protein